MGVIGELADDRAAAMVSDATTNLERLVKHLTGARAHKQRQVREAVRKKARLSARRNEHPRMGPWATVPTSGFVASRTWASAVSWSE